MIIQTVALPVFNSKSIVWLAMEGLCNQIDVTHDWELIICEEIHNKQTGRAFFEGYKERLEEVGCKRVEYIELKDWIPVCQKWKMIGEAASNTSKSFLLQAADCYSFKTRLKEADQYINKEGYDWLDYDKGYFYSFDFGNLILYNKKAETNLNMAFKTEFSRTIPKSFIRNGVDRFLLGHIHLQKENPITLTSPQLKESGVDTDGLNSISKSRKKCFLGKISNPRFQSTSKRLNDLKLPNYIKEKIYDLSKRTEN